MKRRQRVRRGFTLVELLVVIAIIGVLAGLILPGVQAARNAARRTECLNNMHNLGIAFISYQAQKGRLPDAGKWDVADPTTYAEWTLNAVAATNGRYMRHSWCVELLPFIERSDLFDLWDFKVDIATNVDGNVGYWKTNTSKVPGGANSGNLLLGNTPVRVYTCPSDNTLLTGQGNLSYVVNGGFVWSAKINIPAGGGAPTVPNYTLPAGNTARKASNNYRNMGLMFLSTTQEYAQAFSPAKAFIDQKTSSLDQMKDGTTTTVMMSENINTGRNAAWEDATNYPANWACPHPWNTSFFVNGYDYGVGVAGFADGAFSAGYNYNAANNRGAKAPPIDTTSAGIEGGINGDLSGANEGLFPYPNSNHSGVVNALMADGSTRTVNESIDNKVWAKLVTPNGSLLVKPSTGVQAGTSMEDYGTAGYGFTQLPLRDVP